MQATFPHLAGWRSIQCWPEGMSLDTQQGISGAETVVPTTRGRWMASGTVVIHGEASVLQWQAFLAQMEGRVGTTLVPCYSWHRPLDRNGRVVPFNRMGGVQGAQTWEHFGFEGVPPARLTVSFDAPLRATEISVTSQDSTGIRPGQYFSLGERLYQVRSMWNITATRQRLLFRPPLREPVAAGTTLEVDRPVCRMRFTTEAEGQFPHDYADIAPKIQVNFHEAW